MNYENNISLFRHYLETTPAAEISVNDFCAHVYYGEYAREVTAIRRETDKKRRDTLKAQLPAVTISGTFSERKKAGLIQHSGFICIDIDAKENPHVESWPALRDKLAEIDNVFFAALSVSGRGVFLVIPIATPRMHEQHFDALKKDFASMGLTIDKSCRDVSRLRGISFDPEGKINYKAEPYRRIYTPRKWTVNRSYQRKSDDLGKLVDMIVRSGTDITDNYENWFEVGRALVNECGEGGRGAFHQLSQGYHKYDPAECDRQYNACLRSPGQATKGTIFHLAKDHGIYLKDNPVVHRHRVARVSEGQRSPSGSGFFETNKL